MGDRHTSVEKYSLSEHAQLRRAVHHKVLMEHQRQGRIFLPENFSSQPSEATEWALDEYYFLQPVPARQRRAMLHEAGVVRIDSSEREECRSLRLSRGRCGCSCREVCRPPSCACYRSGISCQVDQMAFPCSCSRIGCANPHGRVEFNATRVRAHFIRTLLQLGLEQNVAAADNDSGLPPPAKRCRLDDDQMPTPSLSYSSSSSSSLLVSSAHVDSASVLTTNSFEPQTIYFDSVDSLPSPQGTMVVAFDEDYEEDDDEGSSETCSDDGATDDGILDDADIHGMAAIPHDPRQRTLDNYIIRFSQQHVYADPGSSNCNTGNFPSGLQFGMVTHSTLNAPLNSTVTGCSLTPQCHPLPDNTYCMPYNTRHEYMFQEENRQSCCISDTTDSCSELHNKNCFYISDNSSSNCCVTDDNTLSCSTQQHAVDDSKHGFRLQDDNTCNSSITSGCCSPKNFSQISPAPVNTNSYTVKHSAIRGFSLGISDRHMYSINDDATSIYSGTDTAHGCYGPTDTVFGYSTPDPTAHGNSVSNDAAHAYSTMGDAVPSYSAPHTSFIHTIQQETTHECFIPEDATREYSGCSLLDDSTHGNTVPDDNTHGGCSLDGTLSYYSVSDKTRTCPVMEDSVNDECCGSTDCTLLGNSLPHSVHGDFRDDSEHSGTATDETTFSHFTSENADADSCCTPDNNEDDYVPDDRKHGCPLPIISENYNCLPNTTDGCLAQEDTELGCLDSNNTTVRAVTDPCQHNIRLGCLTHLDSDSIAVTGETEASQPVQNTSCVLAPECIASCSLINVHSDQIIAGTAISETPSDVVSCTVAASDDLSLDHTTLQDTIVTRSCVNSQPHTMTAVSSASSNHLNSVVHSCDNEETR